MIKLNKLAKTAFPRKTYICDKTVLEKANKQENDKFRIMGTWAWLILTDGFRGIGDSLVLRLGVGYSVCFIIVLHFIHKHTHIFIFICAYLCVLIIPCF